MPGTILSKHWHVSMISKIHYYHHVSLLSLCVKAETVATMFISVLRTLPYTMKFQIAVCVARSTGLTEN